MKNPELHRDLTPEERKALGEVAASINLELRTGLPMPRGVILGYAVQLAAVVAPEATLDALLPAGLVEP